MQNTDWQKLKWPGLVLALLASASTWFYVNHILRADQVAEAIAHNRPRGNLSDLYPRWLGSRELLLRGRNPYSAEVKREIQQGYYGRPLDPSRADDPKDEQGFAYPAYVIFLLAPTVRLPFDEVETGFRWLLIVLAIVDVFLWLRVLRWKASCWTILICSLLTAGWLPMVQGVKLQQLSLLVAALLAACGACLAGGWLFLAGGVLALATIKPQLAWPLAAWLFCWVIADWRRRRPVALGFALIMLLLLGGAELLLPGWLRMFVSAIGDYHRYTQNQSVLVWMFGAITGRLLEVLSIVACAACVWVVRGKPADSIEFGRAFALVLALTVVIVPMVAPYNQVLLVPAVLGLVWSGISATVQLPAIRLARRIAGALLLWPWLATIALSASSFWLTPQLRHRLWPMPFYSNFMLPLFVFGLVLLETWMVRETS